MSAGIFRIGTAKPPNMKTGCLMKNVRWFPRTQRASISGVLLMASQIGGAIAPLLVVPIQIRYGWRASFYIFGVLGLIWAAVWYAWFRDSPSEKTRSQPCGT